MQVIEIFEIFWNNHLFLSPPYSVFCFQYRHRNTRGPGADQVFCYSFTFSMQEERLRNSCHNRSHSYVLRCQYRFHIQRTVLTLLLNRIHILRHLDRQTAGRVVTAEDNVEHSGSRNTELCDDRIGFGSIHAYTIGLLTVAQTITGLSPIARRHSRILSRSASL